LGSTIDPRERFIGCLVGLAVGDALGTTLEFAEPGTFEPIADMVGGGPFGLRPGQWTDDTSMALCLATSLLECGGFDARDQMERYSRWAHDGYLSSTGHCFDIGNTVASALGRFRQSGEPYAGSVSPMSAGNGSIMRLAPVPMFYYADAALIERYSAESSRTTHGTAECVDACRLLGLMIGRALAGLPKDQVLDGGAPTFDGAARIVAIARGSYRTKERGEIRGSGYVVDSLEATLWSFVQSSDFESAVLAAANLGDDADTTAAVCGQVAGAYYGVRSIPSGWLDKLAMRDTITDVAVRLYEMATR
jgi:ADP-ribosyl-[dinitrogen reductase] hydrolase